MKPDWKDAPEWANWVAMDSNGLWFWYEKEPVTVDYREWICSGKALQVPIPGPDWDETKEKRP